MVSEYNAESDINDWLKVGLPIVRQLIGNLPEDDKSMHKKVDWRDSRQIDSRRKDKEEPQIGFDGSLKLGCERCGYKHRIRNCPAFGKRCHKCNEKGHFKKMCAKRLNQMRNKKMCWRIAILNLVCFRDIRLTI